MKVYVAGPMRGYADFNFPEFHRVAHMLREVGHEVFDPAERDNAQHGEGFAAGNPQGRLEVAESRGFDLRKTLALDLQWICLHAEAIALLDGWPESKGACAERAAALALGLKVAPYWDLLTGDCR